MLIANPQVTRTAYPAKLAEILSVTAAKESADWLATWPLIHTNTPLFLLEQLATDYGLAKIAMKDESTRSPLGSFKALGAPIALVRLVLRRFADKGWQAADLFAGKHQSALQGFTVISATDGNHGRALAAAAQSLGCQCVIVLHAHVSEERESAIAAYGAKIIRISGNYDESVQEAARLAATNGWEVVSDTSYEGYESIPRDVMQGYGTIAAEMIGTDTHQPAFTHILLQGGVGGMAAGIASYWWEVFGEARPTFIVVEPKQADCLFQSALQGKAATATGTVDSVMAGLACGETSPLAWRILSPCVDFFLTIEDEHAIAAMNLLATGNHGRDVPVVAGESGAAGLGGLMQLVSNEAWRQAVGLSTDSHVLLINSEGATAPSVYEELAGLTADQVLATQSAWLAKHHQ